MDFKLLAPLLTPFTRYSEWKLKLIISLKRHGLYEISIGVGEEYYKEINDWLNDYDIDFGSIGIAISPSMHYLIDYAKYPKDLWEELDRNFGKHNEYHSSNLESAPSTSRVLNSKVSPSILSDEFVQDEEEAESSTQSI